ncbi:MAG: bifunctional 4-hydroxy-2-oxoglutarate aldolase/2-dehydro-3-deoxy-phosphogluconate aldolase [Coriobacteriales bacterium]|jgi:2-dehydro-3-deoxyphosphogluconate aldolase/(4S)-4-hydroxy-2-oxoglutarate aldolase
MDTTELFDTLHNEGIVAVLRSPDVKTALSVAGACAQGGVHAIEVTYSVPGAAEAISELSASPELIVGAGTVLTAEQAKEAIAAGARYIVAPTYSADVLARCAEGGVPYIPGCMTVNEMYTAHTAGCEVVKFFPASSFDPGFIKAVHAPLPDLKIMPTGGISIDNAAAWISAGAFALGAGGKLTKLGEDGLAGVTKRAREFRAAIDATRS